MSAAAIESVRARAPEAAIDLVVGSWNRAIAERLHGIDRVETLDAPWLARGAAAAGTWRLTSTAWSWRARDYDLAINFEGDVRSHALIALGGARRRVGFAMAGGGPLLTDVVEHRPDRHTADNAAALVAAAFPERPLETPAPASGSTCRTRRAAAARALVGPHRALHRRPRQRRAGHQAVGSRSLRRRDDGASPARSARRWC